MQKCGNPIFGKKIFLVILASQVAGFLNQPFLQSKLMKQPNFLHVDTNSQKLKVERSFLGWAWSKVCVTSLVSGL